MLYKGISTLFNGLKYNTVNHKSDINLFNL